MILNQKYLTALSGVFVLLCLVLHTTNVRGQGTHEGTVFLKDGTEVNGWIQEPDLNTKSVLVKKKKMSLKGDKYFQTKVDYIELNKSKEKVVYKVVPVSNGALKAKNRKTLRVFAKVLADAQVKVYVTFTQVESKLPVANFKYLYYCQREGEKLPTLIGLDRTGAVISFNEKGGFSKLASEYFSDAPKLAKRIKSKEFKVTDILKVVDLYTEQQ